MHLHRLSLCAIGPFASSYAIDFDRLTQSGLFLLQGPTGAGKSSIIDAVVFALYGKVAARNGSDGRMYSDFAKAGVEPYVELDFSTSSGRFRVRRTPKYERPKQRGSGTTTQNSTARLWQLHDPDDSAPQVVSTRVDETSMQVQHLVGLSREQFVQTMVLPQGEFANFLQAPVDERRELLQRLFGTELYDEVEGQLEQLRREAARDRQAAVRTLQERVAVFSSAADADADAADEFVQATPDSVVLSARVDAALATLTAKSAELTEEARVAETEAQRQREVHRAGQQREELRLRKVGLLAQLRELEGSQPEVAAARLRLSAATRAETVRPAVELASAAEAELTVAEQAVAIALTAVPGTLRHRPLPQLLAAEREVRDTVAALADAVRRENELPRARQAAEQAEAACRAARERRDQVRTALESLPERARLLREQRDRALEATSRIAAVQAELAQAQQACDAARRLVELTSRRDAALASVTAATTSALLAQEKEHELRSRYLHGIAADLAGQLAVGEPCQVCGSCSHPRPAQPAADAVERHVVDEAEASRIQAVADRDVAMQVLNDFERDWAATEAETRGFTLPDAQVHLTSLRHDLATCEQAAQELKELDQQIRALEGTQKVMRTELTDAEDQLFQAQVHSQSRESLVLEYTDAVADARAEHATVADRVSGLINIADALSTAVQATQERDNARTAYERAKAEAVRRSRDEQFDDPLDVIKALLSQAERESLAQLVSAHDAALQNVRGALKAPEMIVDVDEPIDLLALENVRAAAEQQAQAAMRLATVAAQRLDDAQQRCKEVLAALEEQRIVHDNTAPVLRMANLATANGPDNARAMTLSTFVLVERFRDVVRAANERLLTMSDGRYSLLHTEERVGNRRAGLGLVVFDAYTNQRRDAGTLSGGETFYCSLALALGLADVVSGEAGGIALGTLFIDEGFGSLDADTLDNVMDVLSELSASGRAIGVVSHVPELKERIREGVVVSRLSDGSSRLQAAV